MYPCILYNLSCGAEMLVPLEASGRTGSSCSRCRTGRASLAFQLHCRGRCSTPLCNNEASLHYTQALEALSQLPDSEDIQRQRVETILRLVQVSWMTAGGEQTLEWLAAAEDSAQRRHDMRQLALVHYWTGLFSSMRNTTPQTLAYSQH